ncbi:MAG: metallophosphoesterase [Dehalococcoidia bacterium]|nr:metallophosphoesterase [Dehalococcoidia bacterium]
MHLGAFSSKAESAWSGRNVLIEAAFRGVIDLALGEDADALLIAGDFFDNDRVPQSVVDFAKTELRRFPGPKVLLPGNHDPLDAGRLYDREDLEADVPGLQIVRDRNGQFLELDGLDAVFWGRGYHDDDWSFRPLAGLPERLDGRHHIALGHGHVAGPGDEHRSLLISQEELQAAGGQWDYVALGHWEPHADVSTGTTPAVYSGAPMPLSDANRKAGWAMVVDFGAENVAWRAHPVDPRRRAGEFDA